MQPPQYVYASDQNGSYMCMGNKSYETHIWTRNQTRLKQIFVLRENVKVMMQSCIILDHKRQRRNQLNGMVEAIYIEKEGNKKEAAEPQQIKAMPKITKNK